MRIAARFLPLIAGAAAISAAAFGSAIAQGDLPDGPGKAELQATCTGCHGLDQVISQRKSADDWTSTVNMMASFGASMTPAQQTAIVTYLATNFGPAGASPAPPNNAAPAPAPSAPGATPAPGSSPPAPGAAPPAPAPATPASPSTTPPSSPTPKAG